MKKKASTAALYTHYLTGLVIPTLGSKKAGSVSHGDIAKLHGAIGKRRPVTANRVVATLSGLFSYGAKLENSPMSSIQQKASSLTKSGPANATSVP